jgi:imidazolonepropionase-like amidohydrolase
MKFELSRFVAAATLALGLHGPCTAQQATSGAEASTLFQNVRVFDGKSGAISGPTNVLVTGRTIARISNAPIVVDPNARTTVIAGNGRTLMPGLIDSHWHAMLVRPTAASAINGDVGYINLMAGAEATDTLMRGFTTVRDLGGPVFGLKRASTKGSWSARESIHRVPSSPSSVDTATSVSPLTCRGSSADR